MLIDPVIIQLKTYCPLFEGRVAGAADYAVGIETAVNLTLPSCFVFPEDDEPSVNQNKGYALRQLVKEKIAVVFCVTNVADRRGQTAVDSVETIKYAIFAALLNWNPSNIPRSAQGLYYAGGHLLGFDRARLFWQMNFVLDATISETDGFTYPGEPLTNVNISIPNYGIDVGIPLPGLS